MHAASRASHQCSRGSLATSSRSHALGCWAPPPPPHQPHHQQHRARLAVVVAAAASQPHQYQRARLAVVAPAASQPQHQPQRSRLAVVAAASPDQKQPQVLAQLSSPFNPDICVVAIPDSPGYPDAMRGAVILTLDSSGNIHSLFRPGSALTGAYWDALAMLPALVPAGLVAILGLGAGTIAHLVHDLYPERQMHGWELDAAVVAVAQQHMGLQQLTDAGCLVAHVGDALSEAAAVEGGAAGIIVDLFADGQLIPQLTQPSVWQGLRQRLLQPGGRVMCNLGVPPGMAGASPSHMGRTLAALDALAEAFEGQVVCSVCGSAETANMMAITGPPPTAEDWAGVPQPLQPLTRGSRFSGWQSHSAFKDSLKSSFFEW